MEGKINNSGELWIDRGKHTCQQGCPFISGGVTKKACGDWCPHFSEPKEDSVISEHGDRKTRIEICHGKTLVFDELTDERKTNVPS